MIISRKSASCEVVFSQEIWLLNCDFKVEWGCNNFFLSKIFFQVLKGDLKKAIETHQMLYEVSKKHTFLPEVHMHAQTKI